MQKNILLRNMDWEKEDDIKNEGKTLVDRSIAAGKIVRNNFGDENLRGKIP